MIRREPQVYNDGIVTIYDVGNAGGAGFRPIKEITEKHVLRYQERTVGVTRFFEAMAAQERVDRVIRIPRCGELTTDQVAALPGGKQYTIVQVQYPAGVLPPSIDLSLRVIEEGERYDIT